MRRLTEGIRAGLGAALGLTGFELLERRLLGRDPVYASSEIARRLLRTSACDGRSALVILRSLVLRGLYGAALGALYTQPRESGYPVSRSWRE